MVSGASIPSCLRPLHHCVRRGIAVSLIVLLLSNCYLAKVLFTSLEFFTRLLLSLQAALTPRAWKTSPSTARPLTNDEVSLCFFVSKPISDVVVTVSRWKILFYRFRKLPAQALHTGPAELLLAHVQCGGSAQGVW
ncbi:hypothetical protein AVEN_134831-1 [Araneus ventricosus]|uniref:Uncharacterized protein n=1 Tax=Araneus ventricosus TaxID=182803 RepID=A0A4Y2Q4G2_ARAVE|nr:hypothetical protein AVEN_38733-1 [Araneus ventricosus]GBN58449.1 hypothetical protein AVEN_134831-1 [Araneus ventricosus]